MKTALLATACLVASVATAAAQGHGGSYRVAGKNFDGSTYSGTAEITVTNLSTAAAPSVDDHIGRYRQYAEAGVQEAIVNLPAAAAPEAVGAFAPVIEAFRG